MDALKSNTLIAQDRARSEDNKLYNIVSGVDIATQAAHTDTLSYLLSISSPDEELAILNFVNQ